MSNVIPLKTSRSYASTDRINDDTHRFVAVLQNKAEQIELAALHSFAVRLRELQGHVQKHKDAPALLPDSPDKSGAIHALDVALEAIQAELAVCASGANKVSKPVIRNAIPQ